MAARGGIINEGESGSNYPLEKMISGGGRRKIVHLDQSSTDRIPPHSNDAEMAVLGAMMLEKEAASRVIQLLQPDSFYREAHRLIYTAMIALADRNQPIDIITLNDELRRMGKLADVGGSHYLSELNMRTPTAANIEHHARIVFERALKRRLISTAMEMIANCYSDATDAFEELDRAEQDIFQIAESRGTRGYHTMKRLTHETIEMLETISQRRSEGAGVIGVPSGLVKLDNLTGGFQRSDMIIIAARPSMGKTGVALSLSRNAAIDYKKAVAFFSLEMSAVQLVLRLISAEAKVDAHRLRTGDLKNEDWQRIVQTIHRLTDAPIFIDDTPALGIMDLRARARLMKREHNVELIVVDYLQLMHAKAESREREISVISRGLKQLAKELDIPIIALSQLNRSVETRGDKRPMLSDLRESGCLTGDTLVAMADTGERVPIAELAGRSDFGVWAFDESTGRIERHTVNRAFSTGVRMVYRMSTRLGRTVRATANHKFLTLDGWHRLDELRAGMHLAVPHQIPTPARVTHMSQSELALLGHLVGNGSSSDDGSVAHLAPRAEISDMVALLATSTFRSRVVPRRRLDGVWHRVDMTPANGENLVATWLTRLGIESLDRETMRLPSRLFRLPQAEIACFVRHLWASCGTLGQRPATDGEESSMHPVVLCNFPTMALAMDVSSLLVRLGIRSRVSAAGGKNANGTWHSEFEVRISGRVDMMRFATVVGAAGAEHVEAMPALMAGLHDLAQEHHVPFGMDDLFAGTPDAPESGCNDIYWDPIVSIQADGVEEVFDLTVPGPHNFIAGDIVAHNSIEQDADVVMFVHRPEYYGITVDEDGMPTEGTAELIIGKQRNGPTGVAKTAFVKEYARFENLAFQYDNAPEYLPPSTSDDDAPF